jgi:GNAT superfamily N-acetyltransferase
MSIAVRSLVEGDHDEWLVLWRGYQKFYGADLSTDEARLWADLMKPTADGPFGLGAFDDDGRMAGLVQYVFHLTTWSKAPRCYLHDLYTTPDRRGGGIGRTLIEAVYAKAAARGCGQVWWLTQDDNHAARLLYDKVAKKTPFIKYAR